MAELATSQLEKAGFSLAKKNTELFSWRWDAQFNAALSTFSIYEKQQVEDLLSPHFPHVWDSNTINNAPVSAKMLANSLDLRHGQLLYTSDPESQQIIFGAWWLWGNGQTVSLRIGAVLTDNESASLETEIKKSFGL